MVVGIYIIITKNIRYLLWNRGLWRSLNNTYPIFLTPCIRCTNHLCDFCDLTDVNPHLYCSEWFKMFTYCDVIDTRAGRQQWWCHNDGLFPRGCYGRFLSTIWCWGQWLNEFVRHVCAKVFNITTGTVRIMALIVVQRKGGIFDYDIFFVTPVFQHGASS